MSEAIRRTAYVFLVRSSDDLNVEVLLYRRINTWYEEGKLGLPGGNVEPSETPEQGVCREALEEIGVTIAPLNLISIAKINDTHKTYKNTLYENYYYYTKVWQGDVINKEPDRCGELTWYPIGNLPSDTIDNVRLCASKIPQH